MVQVGMDEIRETANDATAGGLRASVQSTMDAHWVAAGYTAPNLNVYPWLWLWDSCFHSLIWLELGVPERAVAELRSALGAQDESGFVPHMNFMLDPDASRSFWGRRGASSITQPPMYGHALAQLSRYGLEPPSDLIAAAESGLRFLLESRARHSSGLVLLAHPWESGADDSPRWDSTCPGGYSAAAWYETKGALVRSIERSPGGAPLSNPEFQVASVGFNALVAFNAREMEPLGIGEDVLAAAAEIEGSLAARWDGDLATWLDAGVTEGGSGTVRTADALLVSLVDTDRARLAEVGRDLLDPDAYGGRFGPAGVHRDEPTFDPRGYWRGASWPQVTYLLAIAQDRAGHPGIANELWRCLIDGASASGLGEYWGPDEGIGLGAVPQSWAGLAVLAPGQ